MSYKAHARWALRYADKCFQIDLHFMFQVFGVLQKRHLCSTAALQISQSSFSHHENAIRSLCPRDFEMAAIEEQAHQVFSNPVMQLLQGNLNSVHSKVMGTDKSRIKICSLIWGMCVKKNPPSLWLTIDPADTQDPIAQLLCGKDIDLDHFDSNEYQSDAAAVAADPFASASFIHLLINAVLQEFFCISSYNSNHVVEHQTGILGHFEGYIAMVELKGKEHSIFTGFSGLVTLFLCHK